MMGRRGLLGAAVAAAAAGLSGCGILRTDYGELSSRAAEGVPGVSGAEIESVTGAMFERILRGTVQIDASDREGGLAVWDEAMRAIVTAIHDQGKPEEDATYRVGGILGVLADGTELDALALDPEMPTEDPRLDRVTAGSFYGRYGLA